MCVMCMKNRIIVLIIIIISLGQIILSYMANTSGTHAHIHACMHTHTFAHTPAHRRHHPCSCCSMGRSRDSFGGDTSKQSVRRHATAMIIPGRHLSGRDRAALLLIFPSTGTRLVHYVSFYPATKKVYIHTYIYSL